MNAGAFAWAGKCMFSPRVATEQIAGSHKQDKQVCKDLRDVPMKNAYWTGTWPASAGRAKSMFKTISLCSYMDARMFCFKGTR